MRLPKHLYQHPHGVFYFVLSVPRAVAAEVQGFPRVRYSLHTKDPATAKAEAYKHTAHWLGEFQKMKGPKVSEILANKKLEQMVVATKSGFVSQAKTREERELDLEEIGRLTDAGIEPRDLMEAQQPKKVVLTPGHLMPRVRLTFQEGIKRWEKVLRKENPNEKTLEKKLHSVFELKIFVGSNKSLHTIGKEDLSDFKLHLLDQDNSLSTLNNKYVFIQQFFEEMISTGFYKGDNPAAGIVKYSKRQKIRDTENNKHLPYDEDELKAIFNPDTYPTHSPHLFFGVMLSYYTGMRVNEVAQLIIADIDRKKHIINIKKGSGQSLKSASANRTIPIHKDLVQAGLYDYIDDLEELEQFRLFPNLKKTKNNYGGRLGSDFARHLTKIGIKQARKNFHSLRETFIEMLDAMKVDIVSASYFVGHKVDTMLFQHYLVKNPQLTTPESLKEICLPAIKPRLKGIKYSKGMLNKYFAERGIS